jgi:hypothetical protein
MAETRRTAETAGRGHGLGAGPRCRRSSLDRLDGGWTVSAARAHGMGAGRSISGAGAGAVSAGAARGPAGAGSCCRAPCGAHCAHCAVTEA